MNEKTEYSQFDYSKSDSSFYSVDYEKESDSTGRVLTKNFKAKELPKSKININKANAAELATLPGIGIKTAEKILEYRKGIKAFKNINGLKNVKGISNGKFNKLKDYIVAE